MSEYSELQVKAKKLGLKYIGVSKEGLKSSIANATPETKADTKSTPEDKSKEETKAIAPNIAAVFNGKIQIRRYTLETHGENFEALANEFASKGDKGYIVKLEEKVLGVRCDNCGETVRLDN